MERQQQYSWRNCLLIHGITLSAKENIDEKAKIFFHDYLGITIADADIDRSHRIAGATSPIIVKFARHNVKNMNQSQKKICQRELINNRIIHRQTSKMHEEIESSKRAR